MAHIVKFVELSRQYLNYSDKSSFLSLVEAISLIAKSTKVNHFPQQWVRF